MCAHASVKYAEMFFPGGDKVLTKEVVRGVEAAVAGTRPTTDMALRVAWLDSEGL